MTASSSLQSDLPECRKITDFLMVRFKQQNPSETTLLHYNLYISCITWESESRHQQGILQEGRALKKKAFDFKPETEHPKAIEMLLSRQKEA